MENQNFFQDTVLEMNPLMQHTSSDKPLPSNRDILDSISKLRETLQKQKFTNVLDPKGHEIASAVDEFLMTSESFIHEKNPDEAIQKFIERCALFGKKVKMEAEINRTMYQPEANQALDKLSDVSTHLKHIIQQLFSSSDTREMMREVEQFIEKCYSLGKKMSDEKKKLSEVPKEQRQEIGKDILKLYSKIGSTPAWKELREDIMSLYDYSISEKELISSSLRREFQLLLEDACDIMNRFTERNVFKLRRMMEQSFESIEKDEDAKEFFKSMRKWTDYIIDHPECVDDDKIMKQGDMNMELGMRVFEKHSEDFSKIAEELKEILRSIQNDRFINRYKGNIIDVGESLKGSYLDTIVQLKTLMAPILGEALKYAKLPRILEYDSSSSWTLDNIAICGDASHLDDIVLDFRIGLKNVIEIILFVRQIDIVLKDVDFTYDRTSIPAFSDMGKLNAKISSPGWRLKWVVNQKAGREAFFELADVDGRIKYFDIEITQANHSLIDSMLINMWIPSLRRRAERAIENMLAEKAVPLTEKINKFFTSHQQPGVVNPKVQEKVNRSVGGEAVQAREKVSSKTL